MLEILRVSLAECAGKKQTATILLVELDIIAKMSEQFDAAGHDKIVAEIAQVLRSSIQSHDTIGRTRGEQFAVLLRGLSIQSAAARVAEIKKKLDANPVLESIGVRLHVGHTCTIPETATPDVEAELEAARNSLARARRVKAATRA
jgi:diguanylate cyclase (GGDEF)-like protein